jgi:hypothetical protein
MKKFLYFLLAIVTLATFGCTGDSSTFMSSVGTPNPTKFTPKGTVNGVLVDVCTNSPIANADVYILDKKATTSTQGIFTIKNVPANTAVGNEPDNTALGLPLGSGTSLLSNGLNSWDTYNVVIDMARVNKEIADYNANPKNTVKKPYYPAFAYHTVKVSYTSLGETLTQVAGATNHDTPVDGFVANIKPMVGKLAANLNIQVVRDYDAVPVGTGCVVELISISPLDGFADSNSYTGNLANVIATANTDANGIAKFANVESAHLYYAKATVTINNKVWTGHQIVFTQCDGTTTNFYLAGPNPAMTVSNASDNVDDVDPFVQSVIPASLSDIAPSDTTQVVFTFNEILKSSPYLLATTASSSAAGGIYKDIIVNYDGPKAGNMAYTMAWDSATSPKVLTVTIATAKSSKYTVDMTNVLPNLKDLNGNTAVFTSAAKTTFTTNGGLDVTAPVISRVGITNSIEWLPVANAYKYRIYIAQVVDGVTFGYTTTPAMETAFTTFDTTPFLATPPFNQGEVKVSYKVKVVTLNTDGTESAASNEVVIDDKTPPVATVNAASTNPVGAFGVNEAKTFTLIVDFNEVMDKASVLTLGNWTAVMTVSAAGPMTFAATGVNVTYPTATSTQVTITYTLTNGATAQNLTAIQFSTTAKDLNGNTTTPAQFGGF